ncbi:MAG: DUF835 domain-containing protein [Methanomassiliicoccales archaeon]|nr:DUF835 domain-containing protein [Methanomassiliicoccales archaeon]
MGGAESRLGKSVLEGYLIFTIISPIIGILGLLLGIYVYMRNPFLETTRTFFGIMVLFLLAGLLDFILMNAPGEAAAVAVGRILVVCVVLIFGGFLYLSSLLPFERRRNWFKAHRIEYVVILILLGMIPASSVEVVSSVYGWGIPDTFPIFALVAIVLALTILALSVLYRVYRSATDVGVRTQCVLMSIGIVFPLAYSGLLVILDSLGAGNPPQLAPGFLLTSIVFLYAISKHKLFLVSPVAEVGRDRKGRPDKPPSNIIGPGCYLIEMKRPDEAYRMFVGQVERGAKGLLISRTHPDAAKEKYGLVKTPIIWLASQPGPDRIEPANLSILQHTIIEFLRRGKDAVVMLDGLEYLISNNPVEKVLKTVYAIKDEIVISDSKFLVPVDPDVLDPAHLALFEREFEVLKTSGGAGTEI